ncbi:hypothetical protein ACFGVS_19080 [Mucilaginibacter sp. AW1-7]|uniref:hypothetical protein n=1 Tax=Mucilaginibacter sp. AW1-7 TaxID=3349874 RepID=UPI003F73F7EC
MKKHMNVAISPHSYQDPLESFLKVLNELIESLSQSRKNIFNNFSNCHQIRKSRKDFEKLMKEILKKFDCLSEKDKATIELSTYRLLQRIEVLAPRAICEVKEDNIPIFSHFLIWQIRKTLKSFRASQKKMADQLYPDRSKEILSNPDLYQNLVATWGDLAND